MSAQIIQTLEFTQMIATWTPLEIPAGPPSSYRATMYFFPITFWPHARNINQNWYPVVLLIATNVRDPHLGHE